MRYIFWLLALWFTVTPLTVSAQTCPAATPLGGGQTFQIPSGTPVSQWPTSLQPGDSVLFQRGGVYNMTQRYQITADGTPAAKIVFGTYGTGARPILDGNIGCSGSGTPDTRCSAAGIPITSHYGFSFVGANHVVIDGLDFVDHGLAIHVNDDSNFITLRRSRVRDVNAACVLIHNRSDDALVEYNEITNCGRTSNGESVYVATDPANTSTEDVTLRPVIR